MSYIEIPKPSAPVYEEVQESSNYLLINDTDFLLINEQGGRLIISKDNGQFDSINKPSGDTNLIEFLNSTIDSVSTFIDDYEDDIYTTINKPL